MRRDWIRVVSRPPARRFYMQIVAETIERAGGNKNLEGREARLIRGICRRDLSAPAIPRD